MIKRRFEVTRAAWRSALVVALLGAFSLVGLGLLPSDGSTVFMALVIAPLLLVALIVHTVRTKGRARRWTAVTWLACVAIVGLIATHFVLAQTTARWLLQGRVLTAAIAGLPSPDDGMLKHVEWDAWGFAGASTVEYLVFDPDDALSAMTRRQAPITAPGIPCEVGRIRRVTSRYYVVTFHTEQVWGHCGTH